MTLPLTEQQEKLWRYIRSCKRSPSFAEMTMALGLSSQSGTHRIVNALRDKGYVSYMPYRARSIIALEPVPPVGPNFGIIMVPLRGRIS